MLYIKMTPFQLAMMADSEKQGKLFWKRVEKMPEALRKKLWESLSPGEKRRVVELRKIVGKSEEEVSEPPKKRKVDSAFNP